MKRKYILMCYVILFDTINRFYNSINNLIHILNIIYKYFIYLIIYFKLNYLIYY